MCSETARIEPVSRVVSSTTLNLQAPSTAASVSGPSGSSGCQLPVNGALAAVAVLNGVAAASSKTTLHRLSPPPPEPENSVALAPPVALSVPVRSATNGWSSPAVAAFVQSVPSIENVSSSAYPTPLTGIVTDAPAGLLSGIATGGPA